MVDRRSGRDHFNVSTVIRQSGKMVAVGDKFPDANLHDQFPPDFKVRLRPLNPPSTRAIPGDRKKNNQESRRHPPSLHSIVPASHPSRPRRPDRIAPRSIHDTGEHHLAPRGQEDHRGRPPRRLHTHLIHVPGPGISRGTGQTQGCRNRRSARVLRR